MFIRKKIKINEPKNFQPVGDTFVISGSVSKSWLKSDFGFRNDLSLELYDITGQCIMGSGINLGVSSKEVEEAKDDAFFNFSSVFQFSYLGSGFIEKSEGCMNIRLTGWNKKSQTIFIPVNVKYFEPKNGVSPEIRKKHKNMGRIIKRYEKDLIIYNKKWEKIFKSRHKKMYLGDEKDTQGQYINFTNPDNWKILEGILGLFEEENKKNEKSKSKYTFSKEDKAEEKLNKKYKDVIEWRGPLLGGMIGNMDGFKFMVFSNDHDKHFHVVHKGRGVDARFSFPNIELINYKNSGNYISSKEKSRIINYFKIPENFKILEAEFVRREELLK